MLTLFTTAVAAEELFMMCHGFTYKYVQNPAGDKFFMKNKSTNNKYVEWCTEAPQGAQIAKEGWVRIVKDNKATCISKKITYPNSKMTNTVSVSDFINLTRHVEWYQIKTGSKKNVKDVTCKKLLN